MRQRVDVGMVVRRLTVYVDVQISRWFNPLVDYELTFTCHSFNDYMACMFHHIQENVQFKERGNHPEANLRVKQVFWLIFSHCTSHIFSMEVYMQKMAV